MNKTIYLKIKIKSLAAEAGIIRREESRVWREWAFEKTWHPHPPSLPPAITAKIAGGGVPGFARWSRRIQHHLLPDDRRDHKFQAISERRHQTFLELQHHRRKDVRRAARAAQLAYAYLRRKPYLTVERKTHDWKTVRNQRSLAGGLVTDIARNVEKFGSWSPMASTLNEAMPTGPAARRRDAIRAAIETWVASDEWPAEVDLAGVAVEAAKG